MLTAIGLLWLVGPVKIRARNMSTYKYMQTHTFISKFIFTSIYIFETKSFILIPILILVKTRFILVFFLSIFITHSHG